jgi:hypothetical protein
LAILEAVVTKFVMNVAGGAGKFCRKVLYGGKGFERLCFRNSSEKN